MEALEKSQKTSTSLQEIKKAMKEVGKESFFYMPLTGEDCEKLNKFIDEIINH